MGILLYAHMAASPESRHGKKKLGPAQLQAVAELFSVLSEPSRLRILQILKDGPANVTEIAAQLEMRQANVSKQLGILYRAGIITREKNGNQVRYWIRMPLVLDLCGLMCNRLHQDAQSQARLLATRRT